MKDMYIMCLPCFKAEFISKEDVKDDFLILALIKGHECIYFNTYKKLLHCARRTAMFLILGYFFVPLEDVKLRQLTRRRRLHNLQLSEIFSD